MSWGVLAYIVADEASNFGDDLDNSLDKAAGEDLGKLLKAASDTGVPIAAQIDYEGRPGIWRQLRSAGASGKPVEAREANSNNPDVLREFLNWGRSQLNAERYLVMLWGHGTGPTGFFSDSAAAPGAQGHPLSPRQLASALRLPEAMPLTGAKPSGGAKDPSFDILLVKACFAATLEVAYQLEDRARFVIASQDLIPSQTFWPYRRLFEHLKNATTSGEAVGVTAEKLLDEIGAFYSKESNRPGKTEVPYSLLNPQEAPAVAGHLKELVQAIQAVRKEFDVREATEGARPGDPGLVDIALFCDNLQKFGEETLVEPAGKLKDSLRKLVLKQHPDPTKDDGASRFRGLSLFHHPGYGGESPVRDSAMYGLYKRSLLETKTGWSDIAYRNTQISKLVGDREKI
jgi:hypothetical protein